MTNNISRSGNFIKFQKPVQINMTNIGCKIAFYNNRSELVYYRKNTFAHQLKPFDSLHFIKWSTQGNFVLFYEFEYSLTYHYLYIDFLNECVYRINLEKLDAEKYRFLDELESEKYDEAIVLNQISNLGTKSQPTIKHEMESRQFWEKLLNLNKWYDAKSNKN
jgi:hypothetical protein